MLHVLVLCSVNRPVTRAECYKGGVDVGSQKVSVNGHQPVFSSILEEGKIHMVRRLVVETAGRPTPTQVPLQC